MKHEPYPKIGRSTERAVSGEWVATEKVHGANFVVAFDGQDVEFGKRKAWLSPKSVFFGWQLLRSELVDQVRAVHAALGGKRPVRLYGELFGGSYPHPDVKCVPGLSPIQTGVWYSPSIHFALFDIVLETDSPTFLNFDRIGALCSEIGMLQAPIIQRGARASLSRMSVRFSTKLPGQLGLPPIPNNIAEGFVLKPVAAMSVGKRPVSKHKIEEFDELAFDQSRKFDATARLSIEDLRTLAGLMTNNNRVASARSKVGEEPSALRDEVVLDVLADLDSMFPHRMGRSLSGEEDQLVNAIVDALESRKLSS